MPGDTTSRAGDRFRDPIDKPQPLPRRASKKSPVVSRNLDPTRSTFPAPACLLLLELTRLTRAPEMPGDTTSRAGDRFRDPINEPQPLPRRASTKSPVVSRNLDPTSPHLTTPPAVPSSYSNLLDLHTRPRCPEIQPHAPEIDFATQLTNLTPYLDAPRYFH